MNKMENKTILGCELDVFDTEPATKNILFGLENVLLTPHIAGVTVDSQTKALEAILKLCMK